MSTVTPTYTDNVSVLAAGTLARGSVQRTTVAWASKYGARIFVRLGRGGTTALSAGIDVLLRHTISAGAIIHPTATIPLKGGTTAASSTTCATSDSTSGTTALNVASITGFAAGDLICIQDSGGGTTRLEWARVSKTATGILTLDAPLQYTHTSAGADTVRNQADVFAPVWIDGGATIEVLIDYGAQSTGDTLTYQVLAQTFDSQSIA